MGGIKWVTDSGNSQSLNGYSYLMNNPLSGTDPTGYFRECTTGTNICTGAGKLANEVADTLAAGGSVVFTGLTAKEAAQVQAFASNSGYSSSLGNSQKSQTDGVKGGASDLYRFSDQDKQLFRQVPRSVVNACKSYTLPASCGSKTNDAAITRSANSNKATGAGLNEDFQNFVMLDASETENGVVTTNLEYKGGVNDSLVSDAVQQWTDNGDTIKINYIRNESNSAALDFTMKTTSEIAANLCISECWRAWFVGGRANPDNNSIYLNSDRSNVDLVGVIRHELGHLFFGRGHPQKSGDFFCLVGFLITTATE